MGNKTLYFTLLFLIFATNFCLPQIDLLEGYSELYNTSGGKVVDLLHTDNNFRDSWNNFIQIKEANNFYLFLYDKSNSTVQATLLDCNYNFIIDYTNLSNDYSNLISMDIDNDGNEELIFFNNKNKYFYIYNFNALDYSFTLGGSFKIPDESIKIKKMLKMDDQNHIVLLYDEENKECFLYKLDFNIKNQFRFNWINTINLDNAYSLIEKIIYSDNNIGIILYRPYITVDNIINNGHLISYKFDNNWNYEIKNFGYDFSPNITNIITGKFGSINLKEFGDIILYNQIEGKVDYYYTDNENIIFNGSENSWRKTWSIILPIKKLNGNDNIIFYQTINNGKLPLFNYCNTIQATHPDIIFNNNLIYMTYTPYPFSIDKFENPCVLISEDGYLFRAPQKIFNPIVPKPVSYYNGYAVYNNDPDFIYEDDSFYILYNETFTQSNFLPTFIQDVKVIKLDNKFSLIDSTTIMHQFGTSDDISFSPCLISNNYGYYIFYVKTFLENNVRYSKIIFRNNISKPLLSNWNYIPENDLNNFFNAINFYPWHINILNKYDNYYYMLITGQFNSFSTDGNDLYIARSSDLTNWYLDSTPLLCKDDLNFKQIYRSAGYISNDHLCLYYSYVDYGEETGIGIKRNIDLNDLNFDIRSKNFDKNYRNSLNNFNIFPNPFNCTTKISFDLREQADVKIKIYNILGELVFINQNNNCPKGNYNIKWNASNFSSGIYFCNIDINGIIYSKQLVLTK